MLVPVKVTFNTLQVIVAGWVTLTFGTTTFCVTLTTELAVQPPTAPATVAV